MRVSHALAAGFLALTLMQAANAAPALTDTERAKVKGQMQALQSSKLQDAARSGAAIKDSALRQGDVINQDLSKKQQYIDQKREEWSYVIGPNGAKAVADSKKNAVAASAQEQKEKIAKTALEKAAKQQAAAKKSVENIQQSVEGLKSQVAKDGKFGLKPTGDSLHVRQYGK
jgi:hypothetical protein